MVTINAANHRKQMTCAFPHNAPPGCCACPRGGALSSRRRRTRRPPAPPTEFRVLQYNIQLDNKSYIREGVDVRAAAIPVALAANPQLALADAITFCEAFDDKSRKILIQGLQKLGWQYVTDVVHKKIEVSNGGIFIASRHPIVASAQVVYTGAIGTDALASKGVMYARIQKGDGGSRSFTSSKPSPEKTKIYNVFATHLQAWDTEEAGAVRLDELHQMSDFVQSQGIATDEPVIFAGDFNINLYTNPDQYASMLNILDAEAPVRVGPQKYTSDPSTNALVGQDGAADALGCGDAYYLAISNSCLGGAVSCTCCPSEYLDYVLQCKRHRRASAKTFAVECVPLKNATPLQFTNWHAAPVRPPIQMCTVDLSDHYPVICTFSYD